MVFSAKDFVSLISVLIWPIVVLSALVVFRAPLSRFLSELGGRATKLSILQVAFEFAPASEFKPSWTAAGTDMDFRKLTPSYAFDSYAHSLFEEIKSPKVSDYAIIDLGHDKQWLSSRLYLFALILGRMRGLKCFVFLETRGDTRRYFIGTAATDDVRQALAQHYPWLETAFNEAYDKLFPTVVNITKYIPILTNPWTLDPDNGRNLAQHFINEIQKTTPPLPYEEKDWIAIDQPVTTWEHTEWIDGDLRSRLLEPILQKDALEDNINDPDSKRTRAILLSTGTFVAIVGKDGSFRDLIERQQILNQIGEKYITLT